MNQKPLVHTRHMAAMVQSATEGSKNTEYYWPHARGHASHYAVTNFAAPPNLNSSLSWNWHDPAGRFHTTVVSGPLLDNEKNIYIATSNSVRKFHMNGTQLWAYTPRGDIGYCPSLMDGALFGSTQNGFVFALDMETGRERWAERKAETGPGDTGYCESHDGVVVTGVNSGPGGGAMTMIGVNAMNGATLWEYASPAQLWNIMPVFPGDGSAIVMDIHGGVYKHALHNSSLLWSTRPPTESAGTFSDGGVMVGPDGTAYTCSNYKGRGNQGEHGALRAYRLHDGHMLWDRFLEYPCNSWPAVAPDGRSVVVPTGAFVASPAASNIDIMTAFKVFPPQMQEMSLSLGNHELQRYGLPDRTAAVRAFETATGNPLWSTELPPYGRLAARGDEEGFLTRISLGIRSQCLPAQFGAPTIGNDGTVYVGRADGKLYAVGNATGTFETFDAQAGFLHPGTSWAPGMMAVTSCDGLFVWNY